MKIQVASDLHLEFLGRELAGETIIRPVPEADVLVLAGDIACGTRAVELFQHWPVPVLYVAGNHEFYGGDWLKIRDQIRRACSGTSVHFLDEDVLEINDVRFIGSTLWSDFCVRGHTQQEGMAEAGRRIQDFYRIWMADGLLTPTRILEEHLRCKAWLQGILQQASDGKKVVTITHHGPHSMSAHRAFPGSLLNGAFTSDLGELLPFADVWIHGHTHDSADYSLGRCRVISNPQGYPLNGRSASSLDELRSENAFFVRDMVIDV